MRMIALLTLYFSLKWGRRNSHFWATKILVVHPCISEIDSIAAFQLLHAQAMLIPPISGADSAVLQLHSFLILLGLTSLWVCPRCLLCVFLQSVWRFVRFSPSPGLAAGRAGTAPCCGLEVLRVQLPVVEQDLYFLTSLFDVWRSWQFSRSPLCREKSELVFLAFWLQLGASKCFQRETAALLGAPLRPWSILEFPKVRRDVLALYYCSSSVVLKLCVGFEWL